MIPAHASCILLSLLLLLLFITTCTTTTLAANTTYIPIVLMHGVAQGNDALAIVVQWINAAMPGAYVHNMEIGNGSKDSMDDQVQIYCNTVKKDPMLAKGFNAIGFSQGTLVTRGYIERCNSPPVFNYIAWAGPQDGQFGTPFVNIPWIDALLQTIPYDPFVQATIAPAQYWKDPFRMEEYLEKSAYLADLNNERPVKNATYRNNILSLKNMVLVYGQRDEVISPRQSAWFYFFANHSDHTIITMQDQPIYYEDWLGFKTLNESGRLHMFKDNCTHFGHHTPACKHNFDDNTLPWLL